MKEVKDLEEQAKVLMAHLPSKQSAAASNAQLGQLWRAAGRPAQRHLFLTCGRGGGAPYACSQVADHFLLSRLRDRLSKLHRHRSLDSGSCGRDGLGWNSRPVFESSAWSRREPFLKVSSTSFEASCGSAFTVLMVPIVDAASNGISQGCGSRNPPQPRAACSESADALAERSTSRTAFKALLALPSSASTQSFDKVNHATLYLRRFLAHRVALCPCLMKRSSVSEWSDQYFAFRARRQSTWPASAAP